MEEMSEDEQRSHVDDNDGYYQILGTYAAATTPNLFYNQTYNTENYNDIQDIKESCYDMVDDSIEFRHSSYGNPRASCLHLYLSMFPEEANSSVIYKGVEYSARSVLVGLCSDASAGSHNVGDEFCISED